MIYKKDNKVLVREIWAQKHGQEMDDQFEIFWQKEEGKSWPGSKKMAKILYMKALDQGMTTQYLIERKRAYFAFLRHPDNSFRSTMMATVFFNQERYNEDWEGQLQQLLEKHNPQPVPVRPSEVTIEKKEELFAK